MEQNRNDDVAAFEAISDNYLYDLQIKADELRSKVAEEKIVNGELQEILCALQGKASVHYQRAEDLGIENFKEMMNQANDELMNAKDESEVLSCEVLDQCQIMLQDVENNAFRLEELRIQFKSATAIEEFSKERSDICEELEEYINSAETQSLNWEKSDEELMTSLQTYEATDLALEYLFQEREQVDNDISAISLKLQTRRSEFN